ncbi:hypothetical protein CRG98_040813, partial [Punica granatum]
GRRGQGRQSATPTPPLRSRASSVGASNLVGGIGVADWRPRTSNRSGTSDLSLVDSGFGATNRRPRLLHRGRRCPLWESETSVEGSRWAIGDPDPSQSIQGSGSPISDPDSSTEVGGVLCGSRRPRWRGQGGRLATPTLPNRFRVRGRQSATLTPPPRSAASSVGGGDLGGGSETSVEGSRWAIGDPDPSQSIQGSGSPISDPDSSTEVGGVLCGSRRPRWRGQGGRLATPILPNRFRVRGRQSATLTPPPRSAASSVGGGDLGGGVGVAD